ncbi:putative transcription factor c2h2 [Erysiphe necator]|uniref:Putative transcription factor c2h2 n=1 Tax=Uncinula necator TaxID=52586 RepID=A0A0B1P026_UNCNE|nr:putative transcription factor c2h2 [Erysiphe necator]
MVDLRSIYCPFCGTETYTDYEIMLHIETYHPEGGISPFVAKEEDDNVSNLAFKNVDFELISSSNVSEAKNALYLEEEASYLEFSQENKNAIKSSEKNKIDVNSTNESFHTNIIVPTKSHDEEQEEIVFKPRCMRNRRLNNKTIQTNTSKIPETRSNSESSVRGASKFLGKSELGPHAHEDKMPTWLIKLLKEEDGVIKTVKRTQNGKLKEIEICPNMMAEIIPLLVHFLTEDKSTLYAYTCHPCVRHVSRLKREDGFCGYRNIQMMTSFIVATNSQGCEVLGKKIPSIFDIQDFIEMAWDLGFNSHGRVETNGIRGTRKYIGTSEAQAMFCGLGIPCEVQGITKCKITNIPAYELLLTAAEDYFRNQSADLEFKVRCTSSPPIYLQHQGHSMTIVGFEKKIDGSRNLIVFDPRYFDSFKIMELVDRAAINMRSENILGAYRKGISYLKRFKEFEILKLCCPSGISGVTAQS